MSASPKCTGEGCPFRKNCYRFTCQPVEDQKYFDKAPMTGDVMKVCDQFIGWEG